MVILNMVWFPWSGLWTERQRRGRAVIPPLWRWNSDCGRCRQRFAKPGEKPFL